VSQPDTSRLAQSEALDLGAYLRPLWRRKWVVLLVVVVAAGGTYFLESRQPKRYVSGTSVLIQDADPAAAVDATQPLAPPTPQQMVDLASVFTDQAITATVYKDLGMPLGSAGTVTVAPEVGSGATESSILGVTATSATPILAARLANTYVAAFRASQSAAQAAQASSDLSATRQALSTLANTSANATQRQQLITQESVLRTQVLNPSSGATQIDTAVPPGAPSSPRPTRDAILGGLVGLLLGIGIAFAVELFDRRLVHVSSVEATYGTPVLAVLPHVRNPTPIQDGRAIVPPTFIESVRSLRINLGMVRGEAPPRSLLVASAIPGEGKSTVARDLALVYAEAGAAVLIIDADLRRPSMAKLFGVDSSPGLVQVLRREMSPSQAAIPVYWSTTRDVSLNGHGPEPRPPQGHPGTIDLLDYGDSVPNPVTLLGSDTMVSLLAAAPKRYDVTIIDSAPLLAVADTVPLLERVDAVLLVARLGLSTSDSAERLMTLLQRVPQTNIVGIVTNDMRAGRRGGQKNYGYYGYSASMPPRGGPGKTVDLLDFDKLTQE
jgi:Mrp family chromosome partitioning ATPase